MNISTLRGWAADWRHYLAEFVATFIFVLISSTAVLVEMLFGGIGVLGVAFAIGFSYAALVFVSAYLAGGYLNPTITVALWLVQRLSTVKTIFFIIAQVLASFAAAIVLLLIFGADGVEFGLGAPSLGVDINLSQAVLIEAIFSAALVFAVFGTMVDRRGPISFGPLVLGLLLTAMTIILLPISGAGLNSVRAVGPAVVADTTNTLAVWIVGPLAGSLIAIIYELAFLKKKN